MSDKKCHGIREVKTYMDEAGREVKEFIQVFGKDPEPPIVKGAVMIKIGAMAPNGMPMGAQNVRLEWMFPEGTTIKAAFETFDKVADAELETFKKEHQERMRANRIVPAAGMPPLVGADGKPVMIKT